MLYLLTLLCKVYFVRSSKEKMQQILSIIVDYFLHIENCCSVTPAFTSP